ncbi:MAG: precorrin-6y C5,15-methyltransferase (decarboxylating) subunit CbiE [Atopobiaceae bacterium]|nr:precorrin-6y C5,15-methyltransferase (decarboxylating) subunit CbiE [Atopobiaceae bacterium]
MVCKVYVIGLGMGNPSTLTLAAHESLGQSDLIISAPRLLESLEGYTAKHLALVRATEIAEALRTTEATTASVVMSGDVGFYSGAAPLLPLLDGMDVQVIPGISSLAYLCAKLGQSWQDVFCASAHGRNCDVAGIVQSHERSYFLTGGASSAQTLCRELVRRGLGEVHIWVGERLSYPDEQITQGSAAELAGRSFDALSVMLVCNDAPLGKYALAPHLPDTAFQRGKVPMTKEEVRELVVCKLRILPTDVVWDVGAGTGSVTVELARAAFQGQVCAIEKNDEALGLIRANLEAFDLPNVTVVAGSAPDALEGLPTPARIFVGGSSGRLEQILLTAIQTNPDVRICVAAITLETVTDALRSLRELGLKNQDIVQVSVARAIEAGSYHLMKAQNPVYLICCDGPGASGSEGQG